MHIFYKDVHNVEHNILVRQIGVVDTLPKGNMVCRATDQKYIVCIFFVYTLLLVKKMFMFYFSCSPHKQTSQITETDGTATAGPLIQTR